MTCQEMDDRLNDWVDDTLPEAERRQTEAHLATCAPCREEERRLRQILTHAAALPRSVAPPRDLWPGIAERIGRRRTPRFIAWAPALAVAAAVIIALGAVLYGRPSPAPVHTVVVPSPAIAEGTPYRLRPAAVEMDPGFRGLESDYQAAANSLLEALVERQDDLEPETLATVQQNLAVIDEALANIHRALEKDPSRPELGRLLVLTHRKRVEVLRKMVKVSATLEMS